MNKSAEVISNSSTEGRIDNHDNCDSYDNCETCEKSGNYISTVPPSLPEKEESSVIIARLLEEMQQLRIANRNLQISLEKEQLDRKELESEKNSLTAEIEELTKTLFEEANGMVEVETKARWNLEQTQKRLESDLSKALELLDLETEQTKLLRGIVEEEKALKRSSDPVLWDIDVFAARMSGSYNEDFFPDRTFDSRPRASAKYWESLSSRVIESHEFRNFSVFIDECFRLSYKSSTGANRTSMSEDTIMTILGNPFMKNCLHSDIEPCLNFPVLEKTGKLKSLLKKLLPAMLKNTCCIEPLPGVSSIESASVPGPFNNNVAPHTEDSIIQTPSPSNDSVRTSPLSIRSFISITAPSRSKSNSPVKTSTAINIPSINSSILSPIGNSNTISSFLSRSTPFDSFFGTSPSSITSIESCPVSPKSGAVSSFKCSLCESSTNLVTHRFKISSSSSGKSNWNFTCKYCRTRLVSVASLFTLLRHLIQGLHAHRPKLDIYFDFMHSKREMFYARNGGEIGVMFYGLNDFEAFSRKIE